MKISKEELFRETPITKDEFKKIVRFIDMTYPAKTKNDIPFLAEKETFDVWYDLLKEKRYLSMQLGVRKYCIENKYPPAVSDIAEYTGEMAIKIYETKRIIMDNLEQIRYTLTPANAERDIEFTEEEKNNYLDLVMEDEERELSGYNSKSGQFSSFVSWEMNEQNVDAKTLQEFIDLWRDYWKKRKNPS